MPCPWLSASVVRNLSWQSLPPLMCTSTKHHLQYWRASHSSNSYGYSGVLLQITATTVAQFTIGRMMCYAMTGICVNVMPAFMAECAPACLRGMVTAQLQMQIVVAQLVASGVNYGTSTIKTNAGWQISIGKITHATERILRWQSALTSRERHAISYAYYPACSMAVHCGVSSMV